MSAPKTPLKDLVAGDTLAAGSLILLAGDQITPQPINWLWRDWLAAGKLHLLAGSPGTGKTTLALSLAATLTRGDLWPDGSVSEAGDVVIWSGEDDATDVLAPRLIAMSADMARVSFIDGFRVHGGAALAFDPAKHLPALAAALSAKRSVKLLIVDPLVSAVAADSHKNAEVRRALQPLVDLGQLSGCALLGISHLAKGTQGRDPTERVAGSLAFAALARVVLIAAKRNHDGENVTRLLLRSKSNIGPDEGGFEYEIEQVPLSDFPGVEASCLRWGQAIEGSAHALLSDAEGQHPNQSKLESAADWLLQLLAREPKMQAEVEAAAVISGHSDATVRRAKKRLKVKSINLGESKGWEWSLPEGAQAEPKALN